MAYGNFGERAKAISDALLAHRTLEIIIRISETEQQDFELEENEVSIINDAINLIKLSNIGFKTTQGTFEESNNFISYMASLHAYQNSFRAMYEANMLETQDDIEKTLKSVQEDLITIKEGKDTGDSHKARDFFKYFSNIISKKAMNLSKSHISTIKLPKI